MAELFLSPTLGREFILKEHILKILGPLEGRSVLEFGCGSGYWMRIFKSRGAICTGVDISADQIELAQSLDDSDITYIRENIIKLNLHKKFDVVFIDHVISETKSPKEIIKILKKAKEHVKKNGMVILSEAHPSAAHFPFKNINVKKDYNYFKSGAPVNFRVKQGGNKSIEIKDYHWTMQDLSHFLREAGFIIDEIMEPRFTKKKSSENYLNVRKKFPSHIVIRALVK